MPPSQIHSQSQSPFEKESHGSLEKTSSLETYGDQTAQEVPQWCACKEVPTVSRCQCQINMFHTTVLSTSFAVQKPVMDSELQESGGPLIQTLTKNSP